MMRIVAFILVSISLASCASSAHAPARHDAWNQSLPNAPLLCSGMRISNAYVTDGAGRLIGYTPQVAIKGAVLDRAPVAACVSSGFGPRQGGASGFHKGVDLYTGAPAPVSAGGDGVVEAVTVMRGYGNVVIIRHGRSVTTRYAHLSSFAPGLRPGQRVRRGEIIGMTGRTGNATAIHLHYEIRVADRPLNPLTVGG